MSISSGGPLRSLEARRLLAESFRLLSQHFGIFLPLALAPALLEEAALVALLPGGDAQAPDAFTPGLAIAAFASSLASHIVIALVTLASIDFIAQRNRSLDTYLRITFSQLLPILVIGTLVSVVAGLAAIFFVIPGLYVYAQFFVWLPCLLFEGAGFGCLSRAQSLTRGHRWPLVGILLILALVFFGLMVFLGPVWTALTTGLHGILAALLSAALSGFSYAIIGIFGAKVYLRLRFLEDGETPDRIADAL